VIPRRHDPSLQLGIEGLFVLHLFESGEQPHARPEARYSLPERACSLGGAVDYPVPHLFWCVSFGRRVVETVAEGAVQERVGPVRRREDVETTTHAVDQLGWRYGRKGSVSHRRRRRARGRL
jgi:hypothetical protein